MIIRPNPNKPKYTEEQAELIAWNYMLTFAKGYYQILNITKVENGINQWDNLQTAVSVRCLNIYGKKKTEIVYILEESDNVCGYDFKTSQAKILLEQPKLENTVFEKVPAFLASAIFS